MKGVISLKKRIIPLVLLLAMLLSLPAYAASPRVMTILPAISFDGTTANCRVSVSADRSTDQISAVIQLWNGSTGLVLALMVALSSVCFAEEFDFSNLKKSVDSNSWSYIGSATKDSATENGELKITKMYDADGNETSLYSQVYAKATSSGTSTLVTSGSWYDVPIPSSFQAASKSVSLYCKGHIPWIDCKISGYWNVH